jgi:hypothetical protein
MNSAVFDGRAVLSKTKDEQPHVVLLAPSEAEPKAPGASLQLYWVTAEALERKKYKNQVPVHCFIYVLKKDCLYSWEKWFTL